MAPGINEQGFTLLELIITIVILAVVTGGVAGAVVTSASATRATKQRVSASDDARLSAAFFTRGTAQAAGGTDPVTGVDDPLLGVSRPRTIPGAPCPGRS